MLPLDVHQILVSNHHQETINGVISSQHETIFASVDMQQQSSNHHQQVTEGNANHSNPFLGNVDMPVLETQVSNNHQVESVELTQLEFRMKRKHLVSSRFYYRKMMFQTVLFPY